MATSDTSRGRTVLAMPRADRMLIYLGIPALAVLVGLGLPVFARWLLDASPGLPMRPLFRFVGAVDRPWEIAVNLVIWLLIGLGAAQTAASGSTTVTVDDAEVRVGEGDRIRAVSRTDVAAVFLDGKKLVMLDEESHQLVRDTVGVSRAAVARAFQEHGYPWQDSDPYADRFGKWVPDSPELPPAVHAVLAARETALRKKAHGEVRSLGEAVEKLGFAVREEGTGQYWRPLVRR